MRRLYTLLLAALLAWQPLALAQAPDKPLVLALNWKPEPQFGGFYAARELGHFRDNGLNVDIIEGGSGTPTIQMLQAGRVDYAIVSADEIVISHARGAGDVVALFATYHTSPQGIMTHASRGFASVEEILQGDGVLLWQSGLPYAQFLAKQYAPLKVATAPYLGGIGNFQNDPKVSQQCFVTSEPLAAAAAGLEVKTFLIADTGYNPYTTVLATRRDRLQQAPDEVEAMVAAVRSGWDAYLDDPAPTNAAMAALNRAMSAETFEQSAQAQYALIQHGDDGRTGAMTPERWQTLADQLLDIKVISAPVAADRLFVDM